MPNYNEFQIVILEKKIFGFVAMVEFCIELNSLKEFRRGHCQDASDEVSSKSHCWFFSRSWFCKLLTDDGRTDDGRQAIA